MVIRFYPHVFNDELELIIILVGNLIIDTKFLIKRDIFSIQESIKFSKKREI